MAEYEPVIGVEIQEDGCKIHDPEAIDVEAQVIGSTREGTRQAEPLRLQAARAVPQLPADTR